MNIPPDWLSDHPVVERWEINDPGGKGLEATRITRDAIKPKIQRLVRELKENKDDALEAGNVS